jgi:hypothetical protein
MTLPPEPNPWSREGQSYQWTPQPVYQQPVYPPLPPPPPPRRRARWPWVAVGVVLALVVGAAIWGAVAETRSGPSVAGPALGASQGATTVVTASDKKSQLTVPVSWQDVPKSFRNDLAVIQLGDLRREQYILVVTQHKEDFGSLEAFSEASVEATRSALTGADVSAPRELTIGGLSALQYEITGRAAGVNVVFWYTLVAGKNAFYQVAAWTLPSKRAEAEPTIVQVINSFRELGST